jgi:hypothetical protein
MSDAWQSISIMTDAEIVSMLREFFEGLFPKVCASCGRHFATLRDYIVATQRLWPSVHYDIELGDYKALNPIGGLAMANCLCGTTMALSSDGMPLPRAQAILEWIRTETGRRGSKPTEILDYLRDEVRKQVLAGPIRETASGPMGSRTPNPSADLAPAPASAAAGQPPRQP